ncbi:unnamed protein product [Phaedon cochleariae]|uniref:Flavin-containing monooxygenase n=1 Tax=Phaedon cochleariae TaxID=80249 RepID=A0A9N9SIU1_PHACE|nr:unnamed protein product [Phaedon cochleariae]
MRVAIIGAGAAGLASLRHAKEYGFDCDVFEMRENLGGTWIYTDDVGTDRFGYPVYSAMYKGLRTNLPKEVMGFPDFPIPEQNKSYLTQAEILDFLNLYADRYNLRNFIKFNSIVSEIRPLSTNSWQLTYIQKPTHEKTTATYDAVMVCNGHYNDPVVPEIPGEEIFRGEIQHSHTFRSPEPYEGKRVLVVGAGPSGLDITLQLSKVASEVVFSHHSPEARNTCFPSNVQQRPDIKQVVSENSIEFVDGTCCCFDAIILCTGYKYSFPFLHQSCGVTVDNNFIQPLYKHMVHLEKPTMCFIGIPFNVCTFHMFDLQARYFCQHLNGTMVLPSTEEMRMHTDREMQYRWAKGCSKRQAHMMGQYQEDYYNDLAGDAKTAPIAPVYVKLRDTSVRQLYNDLLNFREDRYKLLDSENFVKVN